MLENPAELFGNLKYYREKYSDKNVPAATPKAAQTDAVDAPELWKKLEQQDFTEDYKDMLQEAAEETEENSLAQAESHLDVKQLQLTHKQLRIAESLREKQEYFLPMYLGDRLAGVHLTMQQSRENKGSVDIRVSLEEACMEAHLQVNGDSIEGYLVGNTPEEVTKLQETSDIFLEWIQTDTSADWKVEALPIVGSRDRTRMTAGETQNAENIETGADTAKLYRLAKGFLQAVADSSRE